MDASTFSHSELLAAELMTNGYCIERELMRISQVNALARDLDGSFASTPRSQGLFYGSRTRRFHGLLARSPLTADFVLKPVIMELVDQILGPYCDRVQLNLTQAIEIEPGSEAQAPHRDQDMWPIHTPGAEYLINVMWPFTPYTADNGATLVWPGSHRRQEEMLIGADEAIAAEMYPGDALVFLGSTLHAGGANRTSVSRRGMIISYSLGWLKPYELPWLAYPPEVAKGFSPELAALAGYRAHRPNLGTYEGRCPSALLRPAMHEGAVDSLRPDQEDLIRAWREGRLSEA
ncbi:phytanoyl-CoA dioxygenase family protein [Novosphingobium sp. G106]|nr:phytanoyl-CoA dioxygenase family protein [Novosphingobium sp. G106]